MCQNWGGFEFDENPMYIYQYSDMVDYMDNFMAGVNVSYKPVPTQEIAVNITDAYNNKFADEYGAGATSLEANSVRHLESSNHPLTYIGLWAGSFLDGKLQTRWSYGIQTQAKHKYSRMIVLGQKLNLPKVQWYFDYMGAFDGLDRQWNLMLKGTYETASVTKVAEWKNYRKSMMYLASVEYYPVKSQDFRVFLAYLGRHYNYSDKVASYGLSDHSTNRIELGFMYRIKAF